MTDKQAQLKEGERFNMGQVQCTITKISTFSGEPHYGFTYMKDVAPGEWAYGCGWMPCVLVHQFTGYVTA